MHTSRKRCDEDLKVGYDSCIKHDYLGRKPTEILPGSIFFMKDC
jgi:hypothetical protein